MTLLTTDTTDMTNDSTQDIPVSSEITEHHDPADFVRFHLMMDGWEHLRLGHQLLTGTGEVPGPMYHSEQASAADKRSRTLAAIVARMEQERGSGKR